MSKPLTPERLEVIKELSDDIRRKSVVLGITASHSDAIALDNMINELIRAYEELKGKHDKLSVELENILLVTRTSTQNDI